MSIKKRNIGQILKFHKIDENNNSIDKKLNELIDLLSQSNLDSETATAYKHKINQAFDHSASVRQRIDPFRELDEETDLSRFELLDRMGHLLSENKLDSKSVKKYNRKEFLQKGILCIIAIVLIVLGFAMIIMPAPPSFEIYTVFYFTPDDGVTIMDLVSLLVILCGIFLFIISLNKLSAIKNGK
ncbi:MAG: hypothetical protein H0X33_05275 [Taibaiella sp.]|nr:hypothetical protein [Taibaiella sp.]